MADFYDIDDSDMDYSAAPARPVTTGTAEDDFYNDTTTVPVELEFQDFDAAAGGGGASYVPSPYGEDVPAEATVPAPSAAGVGAEFGDVPLEPVVIGDLGAEKAEEEAEEEELEVGGKIWTAAYYRQYYNVDIVDVGRRIGKVFVPVGGDFFSTIAGNADLYGWLWVSTTLVFVMAAAGNFASYLAYAVAGRADEWSYDFAKFTFGAGTVYVYVTVMPLLVWIAMNLWLQLEPSLMDHACLYGYSLCPYIPAAVAMMVPLYFVRWAIVGVAALSVTVFLVRNYAPFFKEKKESAGVLAVMLVANFILALIFMVYFFNYFVPAGVIDDESSLESSPASSEVEASSEVGTTEEASSYYYEPSLSATISATPSPSPSPSVSVSPSVSFVPSPSASMAASVSEAASVSASLSIVAGE